MSSRIKNLSLPPKVQQIHPPGPAQTPTRVSGCAGKNKLK